MSEVVAVFLPCLPGESGSLKEAAAEVAAYGNRVLIVPPMDPALTAQDDHDLAAAWVAHNAVNLARLPTQQHVLLVALGPSARYLPALGFAQRASRRHVSGYVLVSPELPRAGVSDWPDAPVTVVCASGSDACQAARLRGWEVLNTEDTAAAVRSVAGEAV